MSIVSEYDILYEKNSDWRIFCISMCDYMHKKFKYETTEGTDSIKQAEYVHTLNIADNSGAKIQTLLGLRLSQYVLSCLMVSVQQD